MSWFSVRREAFRFVAGTPTFFRSSPPALRAFCPYCGTHLTFESELFPDETDVTTCSLDNPEQVPPCDHTRTSSRLNWIRLADGLPEYREVRSDEVAMLQHPAAKALLGR